MLTDQKRRFVAEYLIDLNITQAAIRAGYSPKAAYSTGQRVMKDDEVKAAIEKGMSKRTQRTEVTQDRVLSELAAIGFYDISDFAQVKGGRVTITQTADIPTEKRKAIVGIKDGANGIEVKLADKIRALELIGKHLGMFGGDGKETKPNGIMDAILEAVKNNNV